MKKRYEVMAKCNNVECKTVIFVAIRRTVDRIGTDDKIHRSRHLVCPGCRQWARIMQIREIENGGK